MPRPTSRMTEVMPHTMPNIVKKLRSFVSQSADSVCLRISWNGIRELTPGQQSSFCLDYARTIAKVPLPSAFGDALRYSDEQYPSPGPDGEIGRHSGLKIRRP